MKTTKLVFMFALLLAGAVVVHGQDCTCLSTPYNPNPPCAKVCMFRLLETANFEQLRSMLGMSDSAATKIVARRSGGARSLEDYQAVLTPEEFQVLMAKGNSLTTTQLTTLHNREGFITTMGRTVPSPTLTPIARPEELFIEKKMVGRARRRPSSPFIELPCGMVKGKTYVSVMTDSDNPDTARALKLTFDLIGNGSGEGFLVNEANQTAKPQALTATCTTVSTESGVITLKQDGEIRFNWKFSLYDKGSRLWTVPNAPGTSISGWMLELPAPPTKTP